MYAQTLDTLDYLPGLEEIKLDQSLQEIITPRNSSVFLTLYLSRVQAGFPSPADHYVQKSLDLNEHLIEHPAATFFVRVAGEERESILRIFSLLIDR